MDPLVRSLWSARVGSGRPAAAAFDPLIERYAEPHRHYHGLRHVERVVLDTDRLAREVGLADPAPAIAAAFFHDAVYDPSSATNEADSAALADRTLDELGWPPDRRSEVARLVLATAGHDADDLAAAVLLDADLAVLGASPSVYETYRRGIRAEYASVPDDAWRAGRSVVLHRFLDRPAIYRTAPGRELEARARANLTTELTRLGQ